MPYVVILFLIMGCLSLPAAHAQPFDQPLQNTTQEERAQNLFKELRCMVCQNQSIHDSDAPLAKDMRQLVREKIEEGETNKQIMGFLEARYGEFVLMRPRFAPHTLLLWGAPVLVLIMGGLVGLRLMSKRKVFAEPEPLTEAELKQLNAIKNENDSI